MTSPLAGPDADRTTCMVRLAGELGMKGRRTRLKFQRTLLRNIHDACVSHGLDCEIRTLWSRIFVTCENGSPVDALSRVFGISSYSPIDAFVAADLETIVETGVRLYADRVRGRTYAVRARRSGTHPFRSMDVMQQLGAALNAEATVDLTEPDIEVFVEIRDDEAYLFADRLPGAGGLPLGAESRAVALLSGGFDSPVAAWMLLRRGVALDYVFCNLGGDAYRRMVAEVGKEMADRWSYGTSPRLYVLDFGPVVEELRRVMRGVYLQVGLKRQMYRAAEAIAERRKADALVTGEAVGQVSSQTLANLRAIDAVASRPVLRPLVGADKEEIIALSRRVGTHDMSARVREYCSIGDGRTATGAKAETLVREEEGLDPAVLAAAIEKAEVIDLRRFQLGSLVASGLFVDDVPDGALIVDMREDTTTDFPLSGALRRTEDEFRDGFSDIDRSRPVVLVCPQGMVSAQVAERMQAAGYEAYSLRGGVRRLQTVAAGR
ncbi:MAG: tRNA uracil 4-sulfurtransferase ThiI [Gemmatimonadota bacterium]